MTRSGMDVFHESNAAQSFAAALGSRARGVDGLKFITGFATPDGLDTVVRSVGSQAFWKKLKFFGVGALTPSSAAAFEGAQGHAPTGALLYGHHFRQGERCYTPMVHAKLVVGMSGTKPLWAYVGSANITGHATKDLNTEGGVWLDEPAKVAQISAYMDRIATHRMRPYQSGQEEVFWRPTGDGEFTFELAGGDGDWAFSPAMYLIPVLADPASINFGGVARETFLSDLIFSTAFAKRMERIRQIAIFVFAHSMSELLIGRGLVRAGVLMGTNDAENGETAELTGTLGYLNHHANLPFVHHPRPPSGSVKTQQVVFRTFKSVNDLAAAARVSSQQREFLDEVFSSSDRAQEIISSIRLSGGAQRHPEFTRVEDSVDGVLSVGRKVTSSTRGAFAGQRTDSVADEIDYPRLVTVLGQGVVREKQEFDDRLAAVLRPIPMGAEARIWTPRFSRVGARRPARKSQK